MDELSQQESLREAEEGEETGGGCSRMGEDRQRMVLGWTGEEQEVGLRPSNLPIPTLVPKQHRADYGCSCLLANVLT